MLIDKISEHLSGLGCQVTQESGPGNQRYQTLEVQVDGVEWTFAVHTVRRAPYPSQVPRLDEHREELSELGIAMLVAPYVSVGQGRALTEEGWSWADEQGNLDLRGDSLRIRQRVSTSPPPKTTRGLPGGSGSWAIMRLLIRGAPHPLRPTELAELAGLSQPRVSQVFGRLEDEGLMTRGDKSWQVDREALFEALEAEYEGFEGREKYYYTLDPPLDVALRIPTAARGPYRISADVAADLLVPWRNPSKLIVYVSEWHGPKQLELVEVERGEAANLVVREPSEDSTLRIEGEDLDFEGHSLSLVHPTQMYFDLLELGGGDREEHASRLKTWMLADSETR